MSIFVLPGNAPPPAPPPDNGAREMVVSGWERAQAYASSAVSAANQFLNSMASAADGLSIPVINTDFALPSAPDGYESPTAPVSPGFNMHLVAAPADPALLPVSPFDVGQAPEFTAVALPLNLPAAPGVMTTSVPVAPTLPDVLTPASPNIVLPDVPTMMGINIPAAPALNLPSFSATLALAPASPANTFSFTEAAYTSTLLTDLRARLLEWVDGESTGLDPVVEQAIWDRGRARENTLSGRKIKEAISVYASRGFAKPPGALAVEMMAALQDSQNTLSSLSREVMIKQADLEQTNRHFAFDTAFKVESQLITYQNQIAQRAFDAAKYVQQVAIEIFNGEVQLYATDVQAYGVQAQVFKTLIDAELSKLEVYKAELEGQKLIGELNVQLVEIYKARVTAAMSQVEIFKAQVEAANLGLLANKTRIEAFGAQVNAYDSTVKAKASEYQGYATMVQAEVAKIDLFKGQADAYRSQVEGFRALVEAAVAEKNIEIEVNQKLPVDLFKVRTEVFRTMVEAEATRIGTDIKGYEADVQRFSAEVQGASARVSAGATIFGAEVSGATARANAIIEAAKANIQAVVQRTTLLVEAVKAGAQVSAQMAASALSAVNLSGQIGDSRSFSVQHSASNSLSSNVGSMVGDQTFHNLSTE